MVRGELCSPDTWCHNTQPKNRVMLCMLELILISYSSSKKIEDSCAHGVVLWVSLIMLTMEPIML